MPTYHQLLDRLGIESGGIVLPSLMRALSIPEDRRAAFLDVLRRLSVLDLLVLNERPEMVIVSRYSPDPSLVNSKAVASGIGLAEPLPL